MLGSCAHLVIATADDVVSLYMYYILNDFILPAQLTEF